MVWYLKKKGLKIGNSHISGIPIFGNEPHLIEIGDNVIITHGVIFLTHDSSIAVIEKLNPNATIKKNGKIVIKDNCFIGVNAIILPGITIGHNSIIGAGSVVTKDVSPNTVVAGNPAKVICSTDDYFKKISLMNEEFTKS